MAHCYDSGASTAPMTQRASYHRRIHDSGFGGLTVLKALLELIPEADYAYFGDTLLLPYGSKSVETVARYAVEAARYLEGHGGRSCSSLRVLMAIALRA